MTADSNLDLRDRARFFGALEARRFDVVVIGGGVTGAGIARDAALRGLSVALVEARDFASGTSSRSSKMIHGGLRYLPQGHVKLVRETATERQVLRRIAPHLAKPQRYLIPAKSARSLAALRVGLWLYERLGNVPREERHEALDVAELSRREPAMRTEGLRGAAEYTEFLTDDARLVVATVRSAYAAGATVVSYAEADGLLMEAGRVAGVTLHSTLPGDERQARVLARLVVSAAGVWVDRVRTLEAGQRDARLTLSRGIHVVLARQRLPVRNTVVLPTRDRRMAFAVPHGRFTYVGTNDVFHDHADYWPAFERADVDYLLEAVQANLHTTPIADDDVVALWSGIRPLVSEPGKKPGEVSRRDEIWTSPAGLISIAGGKLSAYRAMAEHVVDLCVERLGDAARPCTTATEPLVGGERTLDAGEIRRLSADGDAAQRLASLYGDEAPAIAAAGGDVAAEARHAVTNEGALTLEDYWVRRSARAWFDDRAGLDALEPAAHAMAPLLGWSSADVERQLAACRALERDSRKPLQTTGSRA
jgi:glycerol-3-phosphate dehydrogenase